MKLRMLNGSHSTIAYLGYLGGYEHVNEAITEPAIRTLVYELMTDEVMSTLPGHFYDLGAYRDALLERFRNPALQHRTWQIAMDGSQKLPQRLLGTIRDRLAQGLTVARAALGVAAWMRYVTGVDEKGSRIDVRDPLASRFRTITESAGGSPAALVDGLLGVAEIFGDDLPRSGAFRAELIGHLSSLLHRGAIETTRRVCAGDQRHTHR
jgi:fructuronate reductase